MDKSYLAHYGVMGMKWGVRNDETLRKYAGPQGDNGLVSGSISDSDILKFSSGVNPNYGKSAGKMPDMYKYDPDAYTSINCAACSVAYDLRRRGLDVEAVPTINAGMNAGMGYDRYFPGAETATASASEVNTTLSSMPIGSRGILTGTTSIGNSHAIAWEMTGSGLRYVDAQSNKVYGSDGFEGHWNQGANMTYYRTDNVDPDEEEIRKDGVIKKSGEDDPIQDAVRDLKGKAHQLTQYKNYVDEGTYKSLISFYKDVGKATIQYILDAKKSS